MPPPPPPPGALPKAKPVQLGKIGGGNPNDNRNALLSSIQKGTKLKKTVTVDKSGPLIPGKTSNVTSSAPVSSPSRSGGSNSQSQTAPRLGGALNFQDELANRLKKSSGSPTSTTSRSNEEKPREVCLQSFIYRSVVFFISSYFELKKHEWR